MESSIWTPEVSLFTALVGLVIVVALLVLVPSQRPRRARETDAAHERTPSHPEPQSEPLLPALKPRAAYTRVTINALGCLIKETSPTALSTDGATLIPEALNSLVNILESLQIFLVVQVADDIGECAVRGALEDGEKCAIQPHRILYCSTLEGVVAIVRQLEPDVHIDACVFTAEELSRFIRNVVLIEKDGNVDKCRHRLNVEQSLSVALAKLFP